MVFKTILGVVCACLTVVSFSTNAALIGVLPATTGGTDWQAYYDTDLDITWTADANINGVDTWANQNIWAAGLTIGGVSGWRLPTTLNSDASCTTPSNSTGFNCTGSEMGHLFNVEGISSVALGPFSNVQSFNYWSGTEFAPNPANAWVFNFGSGSQGAVNKGNNRFAWAVQSGNVGGASVVPVPAAVWLFGSGLIGLIGVARRKVRVLYLNYSRNHVYISPAIVRGFVCLTVRCWPDTDGSVSGSKLQFATPPVAPLHHFC